MAIVLKDIPDAIENYLDTKVTVTITEITPESGNVITPGEFFTFKVKAANATEANGGVHLTNVKYQVWVDNPAVAEILPPATDGTSIKSGNGLIFDPSSTAFDLYPGNTSDFIVFRGRAGMAAGGGMTNLKARIHGQIDLTKLFPQGESTPQQVAALTVVG